MEDAADILASKAPPNSLTSISFAPRPIMLRRQVPPVKLTGVMN